MTDTASTDPATPDTPDTPTTETPDPSTPTAEPPAPQTTRRKPNTRKKPEQTPVTNTRHRRTSHNRDCPDPRPKRRRPRCPPPRRNDATAGTELTRNVALADGAMHTDMTAVVVNPDLPILERLTYGFSGAAAATISGTLATRQGWPPRAVAAVVAGLGALGMWKARNKAVKDAGFGAFSTGGSQLLLLLSKKDDETTGKPPADSKDPKGTKDPKDGKEQASERRQAAALPPGALDAAFERARAAMTIADEHDYEHPPHY